MTPYRFCATRHAHSNKWVGFYSFPKRNRYRTVCLKSLYQTKQEAELAAAFALISQLNANPYRLLPHQSPREAAEALFKRQ